ncbi:MAG: hypothetical protein KGQ61_12535 [Planctomycetes bacterium]|nr:hypothetical protein [Planctomycetota bacterium]
MSLKKSCIRALHVGQEVFLRCVATAVPGVRIGIMSRPCGFFANFFMTLRGLAFCDSIGAVGVPWWGSHCLYLDETTAPNPWDHFFYAPEHADRGLGGAGCPTLSYHPNALPMSAYRAATPRLAAHSLMQRFAEPRRDVLEACDRFITGAFGSQPWIGVHVRATDARRPHESRTSVPVDLVHGEIARRLDQVPGQLIFLASDDAHTIDEFRERYGDKIRYRDCIRSTDGSSLHGHYDGGVSMPAHEKARDVIIDALILSRCDFLIRTHSSVTTYSLCRSPELPYVDLQKEYLGNVPQPWLHILPPGAAQVAQGR